MTTAQIILSILGTTSVAAVLGAVVAGIFNRKKLGADATEIITRAAGGLVERLETENKELRERVARLEDSAARLIPVLQLHAAWDMMAVSKLREGGIVDLPPPPPLYPPDATPTQIIDIVGDRRNA